MPNGCKAFYIEFDYQIITHAMKNYTLLKIAKMIEELKYVPTTCDKEIDYNQAIDQVLIRLEKENVFTYQIYSKQEMLTGLMITYDYVRNCEKIELSAAEYAKAYLDGINGARKDY